MTEHAPHSTRVLGVATSPVVTSAVTLLRVANLTVTPRLRSAGKMPWAYALSHVDPHSAAIVTASTPQDVQLGHGLHPTIRTLVVYRLKDRSAAHEG